MKAFILAFMALLFFSSCQSTRDDSNGEKIISVGKKELSFETISTFIEPKPLSYQDPEGTGLVTVMGFPLNTFLDIFMGETWKEMDSLQFTSRNGNKADIPLVRILKYRPLLAFRFKDSKLSFEKHAPFSLVWDNIKFSDPFKEGTKDWPHQIIRIEISRYSSQYAYQQGLFFNPLTKK